MAGLSEYIEYGLQIRPAENGFIVMIHSKMYVFSTLKATLKFVQETFENAKD